MIVENRNLKFMIREGTTDEKVVEEVVGRRSYLKRGVMLIESGDYWLDLGGNIGTFSVLACAYGARVKTYEPEPENYELLNLNLSLNGFHAETFRAAVIEGGKRKDYLYLCQGDKNKYRHTLTKKRGRNHVEVDCVDINSLLDGEVNAIKLDIEGSELPMFSKGKEWSGVKKMVFEYHFDFDRSVANFHERMDGLRAVGFSVYHSKIPPHITEYNYFPAAKVVHCVRN